MTAPGRHLVGTSGWSYDHWGGGGFYPPEVPRTRWFEHYATRYPTVELNATFYRLPNEQTVTRWRQRAPTGFRFAVKGSRYITHRLKLADAAEPTELFLQRMRHLGQTLAVVLWQLPPNLHLDLGRLEKFLLGLPPGFRHAVKVRHPSWVEEGTFELLAAHQVAWVAVSSRALPPVRRRTAPFVYLRFHGLEGGFAHRYTEDELAPWAEWLRGEGVPGYC